MPRKKPPQTFPNNIPGSISMVLGVIWFFTSIIVFSRLGLLLTMFITFAGFIGIIAGGIYLDEYFTKKKEIQRIEGFRKTRYDMSETSTLPFPLLDEELDDDIELDWEEEEEDIDRAIWEDQVEVKIFADQETPKDNVTIAGLSLAQPKFFLKDEPIICSICKAEIKSGDEIISCPGCNTRFHLRHFAEWIKQKGSCPICQQRVGIR